MLALYVTLGRQLVPLVAEYRQQLRTKLASNSACRCGLPS